MIFQFKIQIAGIKNPEVWRQVVVPSDYSFLQFHKAIRTAFGVEFDKRAMCEFSPSGKGSKPQITSIDLYDGSNSLSAKTTRLSSIFNHQGHTFTYKSDYDDVWIHQIILEQISEEVITDAYCLDGNGAYPTIFCSGVDDYEEMKYILSDKNNLKYEFVREWLELGENETWEEAHKFNLLEVNEQIKQIDNNKKKFRNYTIIPHDTFDEKYGLNPSLWKLIDKTKIQIQNKKTVSNAIRELEKLTREYPNIPHFKNSLALAFLSENRDRNKKRYFEMAHQICADFPEYVMVHTGLAIEYVREKQREKSLEIFGEKFDLSALYPCRNHQFTLVEIFSYHVGVFMYHLDDKNDTEAQKHLDFLEYYFPDEIQNGMYQFQLNLFRMKKENNKTAKMKSVNVIPEQVETSNKAPDFEHPEMEMLYRKGANIDRAALNRIMELPRETLIRDLEKILLDSIARFRYFEENVDLDIPDAPIHALNILSALEAEEALDALFKVLRQDSKYYDFWYGDMITEDFWQFIYRMGQNRLDRLKDFILEPNRYTYARTTVSDAIMHLAAHQPDRKEEVLKWYEDVLQYMMENKNDDAIFEDYVYSSLFEDLLDIADKEQFPLVMRFRDDVLALDEDFSIPKIKKYLTRKIPDYKIREIFTSVHQYYDRWQNWYSDDEEDIDDEDYSNDKPSAPYIAASKVGRNDPCPCGSGKKYKKCCCD